MLFVSKLPRRAVKAGKAGTVVPIGTLDGRMGFVAPPELKTFFKKIEYVSEHIDGRLL
jgi:hypothetical protein